MALNSSTEINLQPTLIEQKTFKMGRCIVEYLRVVFILTIQDPTHQCYDW